MGTPSRLEPGPGDPLEGIERDGHARARVALAFAAERVEAIVRRDGSARV